MDVFELTKEKAAVIFDLTAIPRDRDAAMCFFRYGLGLNHFIRNSNTILSIMKMIKETFLEGEKMEIAKKIKDITIEEVEKEMNKLISIGKNANTISERSKIGNNVVDYFTFLQRLETKGKYDVNYFEFLANIDKFREKKFICIYRLSRLLTTPVECRLSGFFGLE